MQNAYCFNTSTIRNCGLSVEEEIKVIAEAGYKGIELWLSEIDGYVEQIGSVSDLKQMLDENEIKLANIIAFFQWANPDKDKRKKELEEAKRVFTIAKDLDCAYVAAPPMGIVDMADMPLADIASNFAELLKVSRDIGVAPLLEFWGHSKILHSMKEALQVLKMVDESDAMLLADIFHMAKGGDDFEILNEVSGSQLGLFHVNDYPDVPDISILGDDKRVYPGDGAAPLEQITGILEKIGYSGMFSLELFNKEYEKAGAESVAKTGMEKMRKAFGG